MSDRHPRRERSPANILVEPLEDRRLYSVVAMPAPTVHPAARHAEVTVPSAVPHAVRLRPADDEGGDGDAGSSDGDSGSDGGSTDAGGTDTNDGGSDTGGAGGDSGSSDGGATDDGGDASGVDGGGDFDGPPTTSPVDAGTGDGSTAGDAGGTSGNGTGDGSAAGDQPPAGDWYDDTGLPQGDAIVLYPTGNPYDNDLYDGGGGTVLVVTTGPGSPNFGAALRVRLPAHPVAGDSGMATVDVFNTGARAVGHFDLTIGVTPDGSAASAISVAEDQEPVHLGHNRVAVYHVPFTLPDTLPAGTYRFLALVDSGNTFAESNESDNVAIGPAVAVGTATTDVGMTGVTVARRLRSGRPAVMAVHLQNLGTADVAGTTTVTITAKPVAQASSAVPQVVTTVTLPVRLVHGRRLTLPVRIKSLALTAGAYQFTVTVTPVSTADTDVADKSAVSRTVTVV